MNLEKELDTGEYYDKDYFESGIKSHYGSYLDYPFFKEFAQYLWKNFLPKNVLDVGCAKGFIIKWLNRLNVDAKGIDISEYAISEAPEEIKESVKVGDIRNIEFPDNQFEVVICLETLEHVLPENTDQAIKELRRVTNKYIIISMPINEENKHVVDKERSHVNIHSTSFWVNKFRENNLELISLKDWVWQRISPKESNWELKNVFVLKK